MNPQQNKTFEAQLNALGSQLDLISNQLAVMRQTLHGVGSFPQTPNQPMPPFQGFRSNPDIHHGPAYGYVNTCHPFGMGFLPGGSPFPSQSYHCVDENKMNPAWEKKEFSDPSLVYEDGQFSVSSKMQNTIFKTTDFLEKILLLIAPNLVYQPLRGIKFGEDTATGDRVNMLANSVLAPTPMGSVRLITRVFQNYLNRRDRVYQQIPQNVSENQTYNHLTSLDPEVNASQQTLEIQRFCGDARVHAILRERTSGDFPIGPVSIEVVLMVLTGAFEHCFQVINHLVLPWIQKQDEDTAFANEVFLNMTNLVNPPANLPAVPPEAEIPSEG